MTTTNAQAFPNIAVTKYSGEKLHRTDGTGNFGAENITGRSVFFRENQGKSDRMRPLAGQAARLALDAL